MKTNSIIKRLSALILTGSIATVGAIAADTTAAKPATDATPAKTEPTATLTAKKDESAAKETAKENRAWFGGFVENSTMTTGPAHHRTTDVELTKVYKGGPAYNAGLRTGDIIWKFDGERLKDAAQFKHDLHEQKPGTIVRLEILRHGKREEMKVKLGSAPIASAHKQADNARLRG